MRPEQGMKKLAIIGSGAFNERTGTLTQKGISQMEGVGEILRVIAGTDQNSALLLSSRNSHALASVEILRGVVGATVELHDNLWSDRQHPMRRDVTYDLIRTAGNSSSLLIAVTHVDFAKVLSNSFARRDFRTILPGEPRGNGEGILFDYVTRAVSLLKR